jgi:ElaB/YqjD/DUF883 family membrane-anchored ribosome-binding protein
MLGRIESKLGMAREDLTDLLNEMKSEAAPVRYKFDEARAKVESMAGDLKSAATAQAERAYGKARQGVRTWTDDGAEYVRQRPREALLGAFAAGFVVGLLIRR